MTPGLQVLISVYGATAVGAVLFSLSTVWRGITRGQHRRRATPAAELRRALDAFSTWVGRMTVRGRHHRRSRIRSLPTDVREGLATVVEALFYGRPA